MLSKAVKVIPGRTAFFVCDIQERLRDVISNYPQVIGTAVKMVRAAEILQVPVVVTEQVPKVFKATVSEIKERMEPLESNLKYGPYSKSKFGMIVPEVETMLEDKHIQSVVLFGVESHICVLQTALDLLGRGTDVHVLADGISSANSQEIDIALQRMRQAGAQITTSDSLLYQLIGDASAPTFRAFAGLMKEEKEKTSEALRILLSDKMRL